MRKKENHSFRSDRYARWRYLKDKFTTRPFSGRQPTASEWADIFNDLTVKEKEVLAIFRDSNFKARNKLADHNLSKPVLKTRSDGVMFKVWSYFENNL